MIAKPSEITSLTAFMLSDLFNQAGFPPGVVNFVYGLGNKAGEAIVGHPSIRAISFTGGTATGRLIQEIASKTNKKISLELGGKNANVIFADCNLSDAIQTSLRSSFTNQGEVCLCGSRILVERPIYDKFLEAFVKKTEKLKVGDPNASDTFIGALISAQHLAKVKSYIDLARAEDCSVLTGGVAPAGLPESFQKGNFLLPTIIADVKLESRLMKDEIFGPVDGYKHCSVFLIINHRSSVLFRLTAKKKLSILLMTLNMAFQLPSGQVT